MGFRFPLCRQISVPFTSDQLDCIPSCVWPAAGAPGGPAGRPPQNNVNQALIPCVSGPLQAPAGSPPGGPAGRPSQNNVDLLALILHVSSPLQAPAGRPPGEKPCRHGIGCFFPATCSPSPDQSYDLMHSRTTMFPIQGLDRCGDEIPPPHIWYGDPATITEFDRQKMRGQKIIQ